MAEVILPASFVQPIAAKTVELVDGIYFGRDSAGGTVQVIARELLAAADAALQCGMANPMITVTGEEWFAVTKHWALDQARKVWAEKAAGKDEASPNDPPLAE